MKKSDVFQFVMNCSLDDAESLLVVLQDKVARETKVQQHQKQVFAQSNVIKLPLAPKSGTKIKFGGREKDPKSARGLMESYMQKHKKASREQVEAYMKEQNPNLTQSTIDCALGNITRLIPGVQRTREGLKAFYSLAA